MTFITKASAKPIIYGACASICLLGIYAAVLTLVSGWSFAVSQFSEFWYFIVALATGFGIQIGLYTHLRGLIQNGQGSGKIVGVTGATSTVAMVSCCAHYLVNLLPVLGAIGIITFIAQYQIQFFWTGLLINFLGIIYVARKVYKVKQMT